MDKGLSERASGCLLGQLTGDALGSIVEFRSARCILKEYPDGLHQIVGSPLWLTLPGQPTDDSELALALANTLLESGFDIEKVAAAYGQWLRSEPFDVGNAVGQALRAVVAAMPAGASLEEVAHAGAKWESEANGALMRQSPLAIWGYALPAVELAAMVRRDTALTHPNLVCRDASAAVIVAMAKAIREGLDAKATYEATVEWDAAEGTSPSVTQAIEKAGREKPDYQSHQGHVLVALQNALYQALHAGSPEEGVVDTVMEGGDTDTNAAIAGALLGAIYGIDAIPAQWRDAVLNCRPRAGEEGVQCPRPEVYWPDRALELASKLMEKGQ